MTQAICEAQRVTGHRQKSLIVVTGNTFQLFTYGRCITSGSMRDPVLLLPVVAGILGTLVFAFLVLEVVFHIG